MNEKPPRPIDSTQDFKDNTSRNQRLPSLADSLPVIYDLHMGGHFNNLISSYTLLKTASAFASFIFDTLSKKSMAESFLGVDA